MKTILVTGATSGFGEAAARKFVAGGWRAIGTGRRGDRLKRLQEELGDAFLPLEIDMRDREALESLARLDAPWGEIDLLLKMPVLHHRPLRFPKRSGTGCKR